MLIEYNTYNSFVLFLYLVDYLFLGGFVQFSYIYWRFSQRDYLSYHSIETHSLYYKCTVTIYMGLNRIYSSFFSRLGPGDLFRFISVIFFGVCLATFFESVYTNRQAFVYANRPSAVCAPSILLGFCSI